MPEFILGARGHDFGRHDPETLFSSIGQAGFACTQLAFTKAVEGVKSYADVTPALVERARAAAAASGVGIAVDGTYVELSYADEDKRRAEVAKVLSQIPVAKALGAGCMGSETTNMAKQPGVTRKEAQEALLRSLGEILPACDHYGIGVAPYSPIARGMLTGKYRPGVVPEDSRVARKDQRMLETEFREESLVIAQTLKARCEAKGLLPGHFAAAWVLA